MKFVAGFPGKKRLESPMEKKNHANSKTEILSDGPEQQDKVKKLSPAGIRDGSVVTAPDSRSKGCGFESRQD